jgi:hypothetical protein
VLLHPLFSFILFTFTVCVDSRTMSYVAVLEGNGLNEEDKLSTILYQVIVTTTTSSVSRSVTHRVNTPIKIIRSPLSRPSSKYSEHARAMLDHQVVNSSIYLQRMTMGENYE